MAGYIADGVLMRFSAIGNESERSFAKIKEFIPALLAATQPAARPALIGRTLSAAIA
jgi:hypothetical protein